MELLESNLVCPVCSLYLREGISLKSHLQTHSKDKVIEALLNKQNSADGATSSETEAMTSVIRDTSSISLSSENRVTSYSRSTLSILPTSSYIPSSNVNQTPALNCSQTIPALNNIQYMPTVNSNLITQAMIGNSCNSNLTYQQYITSDGNIVIIPMYMSQPSVVVSNNLMNSPVINSCVVVPPSSNNMSSVTVVDANSHETSKLNSPQPCVTIVENCSIRDNASDVPEPDREVRTETPKTSVDDYEKENDAEVASIFQIPIPSENNGEVANAPERTETPSLMDVDDDKISCESFDNADLSDHDHYPLSPYSNDYENELQKSSISPALSIVGIRNDLNYESDSSYQGDGTVTPFDEAPDSVKSDVESIPCENSKSEVDCSKQSENARINGASTSSIRSPIPVTDRNEQFDFIVSNSDNATHILPDNLEESGTSRIEKDHYILPTNDIPRNSPVNSDYSFIGLRNSFLSSASLISSVNKTMFADVDVYTVEKDNHGIFDKDHSGTASAAKEDRRGYAKISETSEDKRKENYRVIGELESAGSSRISPFNIQTDESMPARGELSGQESLSGTENSVWELQVQQSTCVQRCNTSCKKENSDIKIGLQSLMTEINIKMDAETFRNIGNDVADEDSKIVVQKFFKKKVAREFRCFHCKENFDSWKSRQLHIANDHAEEDGLTIEFLFSKKVKPDENDSSDPSQAEIIMCRICNENFENSLTFLQHLKNIHGIKKRNCVCPTCLVHFANAEEYQEHIQKVHPYECMTCGKKFHTRPGYMLHQKRHMKVKPYGCDVCDKSFVTKQKLTEHMNIHTGDNPIKCDMCDSNFKRYSNYQQHKKYLHMNKKRKLKDFICDCGEVFHSKVKLIWHREIHDEKPKQCPFCVERFVHTASLTRHVRKWHNENYLSELVDKKKIRNVTCPVCNVTYLHTSLQTHMKIHEGVKPFSCGECSKTFRTKWNLQLHRWTHMSRSAKPYKCKLCVKAYIHKTDYDAHLRSHSNCRPYSCNVCGRQFIRKYNCIRHMREHKEPRTYKCNICKKMFSRSYYLSEHRKTHTGEKPHTCHVCGKSSATKSNHNKHVKMHNNIRESVNSEG